MDVHSEIGCLLNRLKAHPGMLEYLSTGIIHTWNERMYRGHLFTRWRDGNKENVSGSNISYCAIHDIILHLDDWTTDWDTGLTDDQIHLVKTTTWVDALCHAPLDPFCGVQCRAPIDAMSIRFKTRHVTEQNKTTTNSVVAPREDGAPCA